jgi:hypothetical protein
MPKSRHHRKPTTKKNSYRIRNWSDYNTALKKRGSLTIWLSEEALAHWQYQGPPQRGAQYHYSELAIQTALTVKAIYHLGFRQTEGFLQSVVKLFGVEIDIPDYSTLSRRQKILTVPLAASSPRGPVHVVVDSTGVKVFGEGEWKVRQHGISKRRTWRKLHVAVNEATGEALAIELTTNSVDDAAEVKPLLAQIVTPIKAFGGDGGYDKNKVYSTLEQRSRQQRTAIQINIPPRQDAKIIQHGNAAQAPLARDENLRAIREHGRRRWKEQSGYHRRSLAENFMFRFKTILGPQLNARTFDAQQIEVRIGCMILNRMIALGMPDSYKKI